MRVALIGYGKMGQQIEKVLIHRGHSIDLVIDKNSQQDFTKQAMSNIDVAIEFTYPQTAASNVRKCIEFGVPVVCGTTGWNDDIEQTEQFCRQKMGTMLVASNFSIGVNIFRKINSLLARYMNLQKEYEPTMLEKHHIHKLDYPSGTAITLAEDIIDELERLDNHSTDPTYCKSSLPISVIRRSDIPGTHSICWESPIDEITITHRAKSRKGFALGAVLAAEFIVGKEGVFSIDDLIKL